MDFQYPDADFLDPAIAFPLENVVRLSENGPRHVPIPVFHSENGEISRADDRFAGETPARGRGALPRVITPGGNGDRENRASAGVAALQPGFEFLEVGGGGGREHPGFFLACFPRGSLFSRYG
ncbi:MAG: hypothetical protein H7A52_04890 [Akkermansiaceae bacterium]|nr:hypothetical protein [Akkermansiaceae bacterium]